MQIGAGSTTAGTTNDIAGGTLTIQAGQGKGTGVGGDILFKVAEAGPGSASTLNSLNTVLKISQDADVEITRGPLTLDPPGGGFDATGVVTSFIQKVNNTIITTILIDLSPTAGADAVSTAAADGTAIGQSAAAGNAYITKVTTAKCGIVYKASVGCLEAPGGGEPDLDLWGNTSQIGEGASVTSGGVRLVEAQGDWTTGGFKEGMSYTNGLNDYYLYLANGSGGTGTAGTYNAGKFIITLYGSDTSW